MSESQTQARTATSLHFLSCGMHNHKDVNMDTAVVAFVCFAFCKFCLKLYHWHPVSDVYRGLVDRHLWRPGNGGRGEASAIKAAQAALLMLANRLRQHSNIVTSQDCQPRRGTTGRITHSNSKFFYTSSKHTSPNHKQHAGPQLLDTVVHSKCSQVKKYKKIPKGKNINDEGNKMSPC